MGSSNVTLTMDLWVLRVALWMVNDLDNFFQAIISFLFESQCHVIALGPHGCRHHIEVRPRLAPQQVRPSVALENPWPVGLEEEREAVSSWSSYPHGLLHLSTPLTHLHPFSYAVHGTVPSVFKAQKLYFVAKTCCTSVSCKCTCGMSGLHASQEQMQKNQIVGSICDDIIKIEWYAYILRSLNNIEMVEFHDVFSSFQRSWGPQRKIKPHMTKRLTRTHHGSPLQYLLRG